MIRSVSKGTGGLVFAGVYQQLLKPGVKYFLRSTHLEIAGRVQD